MVELEQAADWLLSSVGATNPDIDPRGVGAAHGMRFKYVSVRSLISVSYSENVIWYDPTISDTRQRGDVAHELGHWTLHNRGLPNTERNARYMAGAILCPREAYTRDLEASRYDLAELRPVYLCSWEVLARRVVELTDAVVSVWDSGRLTARVASPWRPDRYKRKATDLELLAAREARERGNHVEYCDGVRAYCCHSPDHEREIVVAINPMVSSEPTKT